MTCYNCVCVFLSCFRFKNFSNFASFCCSSYSKQKNSEHCQVHFKKIKNRKENFCCYVSFFLNLDTLFYITKKHAIVFDKKNAHTEKHFLVIFMILVKYLLMK